jgi:hypothetical protein
LLVPAPRSGRDLFEAMRVYDPDQGLGKFVERLDMAGVSPRQVFYSVFGRLPSAQASRPQPGYNPRGNLRYLLQGEEFQKRLMVRVLESYPEKQRLLFVHVPKCAGSDLTSILMKQTAALNFRLTERTWFSADKMLAAIRALVENLAYADNIFVHGHVTLKQYMTSGLVRIGDRTFSIVRNPLDMVVSKLNYMLTRFSKDPELKAPDTQGWLPFVSVDKVRLAITSGDYRDVALEMLFAPGLVEGNPVCTYLGEGNAESALELCARADVEISHVDRYDEWLALRWGFSTRRHNASRQLVTLELLGADALRRAEALTEEDRVFVGNVERALQENKTCFVMGTQLAG